jgi:ABC-2 type transport system permease protein
MIIAISLWESIYGSSTHVFGYGHAQMLTYIFISSIVSFFVLSSRTIDVASVIESGDLSLYLIRPIQFFVYWFSRDLADKFQNIVFSACELTVLFLIFHPTLTFPHSLTAIVLTLLATLGGLTMYFFINMLFGFLAFWSPDVWAPRFLFFVIMFFVSGSTFPLDIYPVPIVKLLSFSPFPYLIFFQSKLWLEQLSPTHIAQGFIAMSVWIIVLGAASNWLWKMGVRSYSADGR